MIIKLREQGAVALHIACGDVSDVEFVEDKFEIRTNDDFLYELLKSNENEQCLSKVLGLFGVDDVPTTKRVVEFVKEKHEGMIYCADLLRVNAERGGERKPHCDALVYEMVEFVEGILKEKGKIE